MLLKVGDIVICKNYISSIGSEHNLISGTRYIITYTNEFGVKINKGRGWYYYNYNYFFKINTHGNINRKLTYINY